MMSLVLLVCTSDPIPPDNLVLPVVAAAVAAVSLRSSSGRSVPQQKQQQILQQTDRPTPTGQQQQCPVQRGNARLVTAAASATSSDTVVLWSVHPVPPAITRSYITPCVLGE